MLHHALTLLLAATGAAEGASPQPPLPSHAERTAFQELDACLIRAASDLGVQYYMPLPVDRYATYYASCPSERVHVVRMAMTALPQGVDRNQRLATFERITARIAKRYRIWAARFMDQAPVMDEGLNPFAGLNKAQP